MIGFKQLYESMDKPYSYTWRKVPKPSVTGKLEFVGSFKADGKIISFELDMINSQEEQWEISFGKDLGGGHTIFYLTKDGDAFRVMATVLAMIGDAVKQSKQADWYNMKEIYFSASKGEYNVHSGEEEDSGRTRLYTRMVKKYGSKIGTITIKDTKYEMSYFIKVK